MKSTRRNPVCCALHSALLAVGIALAAPAALAAAVAGQGTWETDLHLRDLTGDSVADAVYDSRQDITWLLDFNQAKSAGDSNTGLFNYWQALSWVTNLTVGAFGDWRLPSGTCAQVTCPDGEMSVLWFDILGNVPFVNPVNTAHFDNLSEAGFWTGSQFSYGCGGYWMFVTAEAYAGPGASCNVDRNMGFAPAVATGDIGAPIQIPLPATWILLAVGVVATCRHRSARITSSK